MRINGSIEHRLNARKKIVKECWEWTGSLNNAGYGRISIKNKLKFVHRISFQIFNKTTLSKNQFLDHLCRNRKCFNPLHLEQVTQSENCKRGETGKHNSKKNKCKLGHPYFGNNLLIRPQNKGRDCRACHNIANKKYREKND